MWAVAALAAVLMAADVSVCQLAILSPPVPGAIALTFPPVTLLETKDGRFATVFNKPGQVVLYWLWVEEGKIKWQQEIVNVKAANGPGPDPGPGPRPDPGPTPPPKPLPKDVSVIWLEESSLRTPGLAKLQQALAEKLQAAGVSFGVVDADNPVSYIKALVAELAKQISNLDFRRGPVVAIVKAGSSQVIAATYVDERNTADQIMEWISGRLARYETKPAVDSSRGTGQYRTYYPGRGTTQPVFCPIPGACPIGP